MPTPLKKFQSLLRELFQFEQADLDFGVYRIMNLRRTHLEKWLNDELPARARAILKQGGNTADDDLGGRLDVLKAALLELEPDGVDEDGNITKDFLKQSTKGKEYLKLKAQADRAPARTAAGMEPLVYNHLYDFFSRYYDTGDFIPKRRRSFAPDGRDTYAIPWDGEEVVLHWANKDQYYIKTGERFTHYRWQSEAGGRTFTVEFRLTDADLPSNNNKDAKKKFNLLIADKVDWQEDKATLILPFHYRGLTPEEEGQYTGTQEAKLRESIIKRTVDTLRGLPAIAGVPQLATALMAPKRDGSGQEKRDKDGNAVPLLPHHLNRWAVKNESDFFIHKDLRRFLSGELDYFLKSVVLNLDNLLAAGEQRAEPNFRLLDAVKRLGTEIVDFVSQLEDFQKALFEKKKFVLETSWCLTLDRIPASVKEEVYTAILANDRQWEEWESLYKISQWPADLATIAPRTREFLEANPFLVFDSGLKLTDGSKAFADHLITELVAAISGLDENIDGTIAQSDNFHALSLLRKYCDGAVEGVYIDPPYNTGADRATGKFVYKDTFEHSSWLAAMRDRLEQCFALCQEGALIFTSLDEEEIHRYSLLLGQLVGEQCLATLPRRTKSGGGSAANHFAVEHDYVAAWAVNKDAAQKIFVPHDEAYLARYKEEDGDGKYFWDTMERSSTATKPYKIEAPDGTWLEGRWFRSEKRFKQDKEKGEVRIIPTAAGGWSVQFKQRLAPGKKLRSMLDEKQFRSNQVDFDQLGLPHFPNPKPENLIEHLLQGAVGNDGLVLDFFGGSGTTGHAVINLNRADEGTRRYLLVEMGDYFDTVLKPRLQKVVFSENWKEGIPQRQANGANPYNGISHCIKVVRLESYEDALDNIEFTSGVAPGAELSLDFRRDYELRYALDWESKDCPTRLAVEQLDTPFDYTLTLRRESGTVEVKPDLPETFAYLIGLHTRRRFRTERDGVSYLIYTGTLHADGTEVAVLWRTCRGWTEANLKAEMDWWREQRETLAPGATRVYVNGASAIEGHHSLDAEFKNRMHGPTA